MVLELYFAFWREITRENVCMTHESNDLCSTLFYWEISYSKENVLLYQFLFLHTLIHTLWTPSRDLTPNEDWGSLCDRYMEEGGWHFWKISPGAFLKISVWSALISHDCCLMGNNFTNKDRSKTNTAGHTTSPPGFWHLNHWWLCTSDMCIGLLCFVM